MESRPFPFFLFRFSSVFSSFLFSISFPLFVVQGDIASKSSYVLI